MSDLVTWEAIGVTITQRKIKILKNCAVNNVKIAQKLHKFKSN